LVTLEMIKLACDAIFLDGINHIINHGYSYSPQVAGKPGWVFYASSVISHTNTWWEYYPEVSRYIQRVSAFLQRGSNYSEVAIYLPQNDIWADFPMSELHMGMKLEEYMGKEAINNIQKNGYWFNYINDEVINELGVISSQGLELNRNCYKVIILMGARRMPTETASKLKEFVEQGGILISAENYPNKACGFLNRESNEKHLNKIMVDLFSQHYDQWKNVGMGKTVVVSNRGAALIDCMKQALKPDVEINPNDGTIGYVHRKDDSDDIYFIANVSKDYKKVDIEFKTIDKGFIILNPLTAEELRPLHIDYLTVCTRLRMEFEPNQSFIVIFSNNIDKSMDTSPVVCENIIAELSFDWQFEVSVLGFKRNLSQLNTWENFEQTRYYCGEGMYHKDIEVTRHILNYDRVFICFEKIYEVAEIFVNGASAGVIWKLPYELDVKKYLHEGRNSIQVKVVNLWINHYLNPHREEPFHGETILDTWPYFGKIIDNIRARRLYSWREKQMVEELQPSGLCGEVYFKGRNWHI
jgi:hypothetical protein